jgi:hypothetical protein
LDGVPCRSAVQCFFFSSQSDYQLTHTLFHSPLPLSPIRPPTYCQKIQAKSTRIIELDEFEAHRLLEKDGQAITVRDMRVKLKEIDLDSNNKVAFIEYAMFLKGKTLEDLFTAKPDTALVAKLEAAILQYRAVLEEKRARQEKMAQLRESAQAGDYRAKGELRRMEMSNAQSEEAVSEVAALRARMAAKRALRDGGQADKQQALEDERRRVAEEEARKKREQEDAHNASRARLAARAALWK